MAKQLLKKLSDSASLFRDTRTGIAWVEDYSAGIGHSCHPNIDETGSVAGMKSRGYWSNGDKTVKSHGFIYNISKLAVHDELDRVAAQHCLCGGKH